MGPFSLRQYTAGRVYPGNRSAFCPSRRQQTTTPPPTADFSTGPNAMPLFALIDCNNFYCSCERLFRPDLRRRPVAVLSNNDGCVVARSAEVKALGIAMGTPLFQIRHLVKQHDIVLFSSNYGLYADISARVMASLRAFSDHLEVYSIDEAFVDLTAAQADLASCGQAIREQLYRHVGVPVSVGIAPTKTLAKLANGAAKRFRQCHGVVDLSQPERQRRLLALTPLEEVWGVGRQLGPRLARLGIRTALQLAEMDVRFVRQRFSVVLERTVRELNGESCLELEEVPAPRKQLVCSRSFGERIETYDELRQALSQLVCQAAARLRRQALKAGIVTLFIRTSPHDAQQPYYGNRASTSLGEASNDSRVLLPLALSLFDKLWREDLRYAKGGVQLEGLCPADQVQPGLFHRPQNEAKSQQLMQALDHLNQSGRARVYFGAQRPEADWFMTRSLLSPAYTRSWDELPQVR
ncbi:MAG: translesion error-prone DNA polymerase V subunit UmuC [Desulfuromonas thiophila]|nr:translesion error-prone DNA polymerase V subunit UmuC [Desulfuromonas thiophila]